MTSREALPAKVAALLRAPANVAVHGSPGAGKSWMSDRVIEELRLSPGDVIVCRLDLSTTRSGYEVFCEALAALSTHNADSPGPGARDGDIHGAWKDLRTLMPTLGAQVVFVLDQFDRVLHFEDAQQFLLLFRELVHRPETMRCTALMASRRSLQSIETRVQGISTLANICYTEYLGAVDAEDLPESWSAAKGITVEKRQECLTWSGGHPTLVKYWLTTRPDLVPDSAAEIQRINVVLRVLNHLDDLKLLDAAAQLCLGPIINDWLIERHELELLGVIPPAGSTTISLSDSELFRDVLRNRTWDMDPWGIIGRAEVQLRSLIQAILSRRLGDDWPEIISKRSPAVAKARTDADLKIARDERMFSKKAPWLSYTYPGDLWAIISIEWEVFATVFDSRDKPYWRTVFDGLSQYRAPLAHGRPEVLGEAQRAQCRIYATALLAKIAAYEARVTEAERAT